ncbi:fluoride efflux transporter FluC [Bifidobacterium catulorum]|uniref:Fluoride-specific ion channel FluC n=1 Tax=Bifidobacterium catulorum TaxID=1630173 RepID=A0A2U2MTZ2_9BIFI|nr:CrcB family protein [Bifidobacterium catulorum]PWG60319.1 hypothetical protein DF200_02800 [Bifidobacterium catulorum]
MAESQRHPGGPGPAARPSTAAGGSAARSPLADSTIYIVVFLGGCLGTAMRYGLSLAASGEQATVGIWSAVHIGTFTANIIACFTYAAIAAYTAQARWIRKRSRDLVSRGFGMGMCGGLSTMSTLAFEQFGDLSHGNIFGVLVYVMLSFGIGILAAYLGVRLALALAGGHKHDADGDGGHTGVKKTSTNPTTSDLPPSIAAKMTDEPPAPVAAPSRTSSDSYRTLWTDDEEARR